MFFKQLLGTAGHMMSIKLAFLPENSIFVAKATSECDFSAGIKMRLKAYS